MADKPGNGQSRDQKTWSPSTMAGAWWTALARAHAAMDANLPS